MVDPCSFSAYKNRNSLNKWVGNISLTKSSNGKTSCIAAKIIIIILL